MNFENINENNYNEIVNYLKALGEEDYRSFHSKIVGETSCEIIGIRLPILRKTAKEILKGDASGFLKCSGRSYYEEIMLRGLVTAQLKGDFSELSENADSFIDYIDNWAVCDTFCCTFKSIKKYPEEFFGHLETYLTSSNQWAVRVGLVMMMNYYLTDYYIDRVLERADNVKRDEYYIRMGKAWLLSTSFVKYRDKTLALIESGTLDKTTLSMTIQKCVDSFRISKEDKEYLKSLRTR